MSNQHFSGTPGDQPRVTPQDTPIAQAFQQTAAATTGQQHIAHSAVAPSHGGQTHGVQTHGVHGNAAESPMVQGHASQQAPHLGHSSPQPAAQQQSMASPELPKRRDLRMSGQLQAVAPAVAPVASAGHHDPDHQTPQVTPQPQATPQPLAAPGTPATHTPPTAPATGTPTPTPPGAHTPPAHTTPQPQTPAQAQAQAQAQATPAPQPTTIGIADPTKPIALAATDVWKTYGTGATEIHALQGITATFAQQHFTAIMGPSGSGKSTLIHSLAGLDRITSGSIRLGDTELSGLTDKQLTLLRRERVGFVFQAYNLLPTLTAERNILMPLKLAGKKPDKDWYQHVTTTLGIQDRLNHKPGELSGGQQQRVAMARALMTRPDVLIADEPTGALDSKSSTQMLEFLQLSVKEFGQTIVMVTHDPRAASYSDRVILLTDGKLAGEILNPTQDRVHHAMMNLGEEL